MVRRLLSESEALVSTHQASRPQRRHQLLKVDLTDAAATAAAVQQADPDLVLHLAAESHVSGTFHLLQAVRDRWEAARRTARFPLPPHQHR